MIHLVTGGTRSGKSSFAEGEMQDASSILYIATGQVTDEEMAHRVKMHQERRGSRYRTYEGHKGLDKVIEQSSEESVLLECVGTMITNMIFDRYRDLEEVNMSEIKAMEMEISSEVDKVLDALTGRKGVIITNEVGMALISEYKLGRVFTDILGRVNQQIALKADRVTLVVSGIAMKIK